jgi:hypothetical protein
MTVHLIGQIQENSFSRGVNLYPMISDPVTLMTDEDLSVIFDKSQQTAQTIVSSSFPLGRFALNTNYKVYLNGRKFFSKHAAILGNSGSGKSCTITKIISESIKHPNTQMIVFDLHGEYRNAFVNEKGKLDSNITYLNESDFVVPYWLLRFNELQTLFVDKSDTRLVPNQISFLKESLKILKKDSAQKFNLSSTYNVDTPIYYNLEYLKNYADNMNHARFVLGTDRYAFAKTAIRNLPLEEQAKILITQKVQFNQGNAQGEIPHALYYQSLGGMIDLFEHRLNDRRFDFLLRPIQHARESEFFSSLYPQIKEDRSDWSEMISWVIRILTGQMQPRRNLTIIDLSGIPFEIIDLTIGLLTRLIFDYNFYTSPELRRPIVMIFEEAHNYIPNEIREHNFARIAVERVAKEGRKYGVSAIILSQRPNEVSHTVLSQCNNMIVLRINNPEDQAYVNKVVSDQFADLIKMLPVLGPGEGFVIGDAVPIPMRTLISLPERRPYSFNMDFMEAWSKSQPEDQLNQTINRWMKQERPMNTNSN